MARKRQSGSAARCADPIDRAPCLPDETTKRDPTAYARCLVERALKVERPRKGRRPVAVLTMGGPASGKSSMVGRMVKKKDLVRSDPDDVKEQIPEYALAVSKCARNAAFMAHAESADIADQIALRAVKEKKNLVIDGTGKNLEHYLSTIKKLKKAGYHVTVVGASIPVEEALKRAEERGARTGRFVPESVVRDIYTKVPCNLRPVAEVADDFVLFDTASPDPRPVMTKERGGKVKISDPGYVSALEATCAMPSRLSGVSASRTSASSDRAPALSLDELVSRALSRRRPR